MRIPDRSAATRPRAARDALITLGLFAVVAVSLGLVAAATGWEETWASLARLGPGQLGLLLLLSGVNYLFRGMRWLLYCRVLGLDVSPVQGLRHYLGGFAMTVTPGRLGEFVRLRWMARELGAPVERSAPLILVDRAADLAVTGLLIGIALAFSAGGLAGGLPVALLALAAAVIVTREGLFLWALDRLWRLVGRWPRLFVKARRAARALGPFSAWKVVLPALALGGVGWFAEGLAFHLLLVWMGADLGLWTAVGIFMIATLTGGATGSPGGLGGAEAAMVALLSLQGVPLEVSLPATAVIRLTTLWFAIAIGVVVFPFANRAAERGLNAT